MLLGTSIPLLLGQVKMSTVKKATDSEQMLQAEGLPSHPTSLPTI